MVTAGGVITDRLVSVALASFEGSGTVSYSFRWTVTAEHVGFNGTAGRSWLRYQANILCPNFDLFDEAPATAKTEEPKKVLAAACMSTEVGMFELETIFPWALLDVSAFRTEAMQFSAAWYIGRRLLR